MNLKIKVLIRKILKTKESSTYSIEALSKKAIEIDSCLLKEGREIINPCDFSLVARIDRIMIPRLETSLEDNYDEKLPLQKPSFDAVIVEILLLNSIKDALKEAQKYKKEDWSVSI